MTESVLKPRRGLLSAEKAKRGLPFYALVLILLFSTALLLVAWLQLPWIAEDDTALPVGRQLLNGSGLRNFAPMWLIPVAAFFLIYAAFPRILYPYLQLLSVPFRLIPSLFGIGSVNVVGLVPLLWRPSTSGLLRILFAIVRFISIPFRIRATRYTPPPISLPAARTAGILILISLVYFLLYKGQITRSLLEALAAIGIAYWVTFAVAVVALNIWRITPDMTGMYGKREEKLPRSENGLMPADSVLQRTLRARKTTAALWRNAFFVANVVGLIALVVLLLNILNQSFGYVLVNYTIKPSELSPNKPLEELSEPELARLFEDRVSPNRLRTIVRDNLLGRQFSPTRLFGAQIEQIFPELKFDPARPDDTFSRALGAKPFPTITANERLTVFSRGLGIPREALANEPIKEAFSGRNFDPAIADKTLRELTIEEAAALLAANAPRPQVTVNFILGEPAKLLFENRVVRPEFADKRYEQLTVTELIDLLEDNLDANQLRRIVIRDVAQLRYDRTWTFLQTLTFPQIIADTKARWIAEIEKDESKSEAAKQEEIAVINGLSDLEVIARAEKDPNLAQGELRFHSWLSLDFVLTELTASPATTGLRTSLIGSLWVIVLTILIALPLGVGAAVYLEEYAEKNLLNAIIETNIRNLAGVPSIIYGMLGLAIFVRALEQFTSGAFIGITDSNGRTVISAAFTMALLILPVVIINAQEAIRAVPSSIREASYGVGATKWQTTWRQVLPAAFPGILTGLILSVSRAIGETAPLLVVGGLTFTLIDPNGPFSKFSVVPIQVYSWTADPAVGFRNVAAAAIIILLTVLLGLNATAIILRQRLSKKLRG
ncbi:MAG: phosphate ABC transporter permease PstA [Anaerolineae bacterium]|nr:phosphate ABC transporter permease PstA [Anaerolineae bacterium]